MLAGGIKPDMSDLMTKPPLAQWLKGAEVAFKKKFLGEKHTIRDENAHPTHHTHLPAHLPTHPLGEKLYEMINDPCYPSRPSHPSHPSHPSPSLTQ